MKISKYFMVAAASIMMFGCAKNDENNGPHFDGPIALSINVVNPELSSKAPVDKTTTTTITISSLKVRLNAAQGGTLGMEEADAEGWLTLNANTKTHTFWDVEEPQSVEVSINGGKASYTDLTDFGSDVAATNVPVYGRTDVAQFDRTGTQEHNGKQYDMYTADVEAKIPVARVELFGITHKAHVGAECEYKELQFESIDFLKVANSATFPYTEATGKVNLDSEVIDSDFLAENVKFPATKGDVYAFNMFTCMPQLRFSFTGSLKDPNSGIPDGSPRYAFVKSFNVNGTPVEKLEAGKIYQVKSIEIADEDYTSDPEGNTLIGVIVNVTVQNWELKETTVEF